MKLAENLLQQKKVKVAENFLQRKSVKLAGNFLQQNCLSPDSFRFSLVVWAIDNDDYYRKENFSIPPMTRVMDPNSLPAKKKKMSANFFVSVLL